MENLSLINQRKRDLINTYKEEILDYEKSIFKMSNDLIEWDIETFNGWHDRISFLKFKIENLELGL